MDFAVFIRREGLGRALIGVLEEPRPDVGAGGHDPRPALAGVSECGPDEGIAQSFAPSRRRDLGVLEVQHVLRELAVDELGLPVRQVNDEAGACRIVTDGDRFGVTVG